MRDKSYYESRAKEIINKIHYLTLATTSATNIPWNSPLSYSVDSNFNFYFGSPEDTQHSQNIRDNGKGFIVIYDSTAPDGEGEGVYMTANIKELTEETDIKNALIVMFGDKSQYETKHFTGESKLRAYIIEPETIWMNDAEEKGQAAKSALAERLKSQAGIVVQPQDMKLAGIIRKITYDQNNILFSDFIFYIYFCVSYSNQLDESLDKGNVFWVSIDEAIENENNSQHPFPSLLKILTTLKSNPSLKNYTPIVEEDLVHISLN